uniref:Uncharacterized protein n=1 Tax=Mucochytrium quahogii TaxID=96639 RepID=A0A7S2S8Z5_9STRA
MPKLTMLALNHNNLQAVTVKHGIHELVSLQTLKLQDNALKSIDPDAIPRCCVSINLSRNNLSCPEAVLKLVKRRSQLSSLVLVGNTALLSNPNAQQQLRRAADRPQFNLKLS